MSYLNTKTKLLILIIVAIISGLLLQLYLSYKTQLLNPEVNNSTLNSITRKSLYTRGIINPPAVVLRTKGGLGNQLFQYACMYALARKHNWPLYIHNPNLIPADSKRRLNPKTRDFALDKFTLPLHGSNIAEKNWNSAESKIYYVTDSNLFSGQYPKDKVIQMSGACYCPSEAFFSHYKEELMDLFQIKIPTKPIQKWIDLIDSKGEGSVALHVRQGDVLKLNITVPTTFYLKAMEQISQILKVKPTFFIFSDDGEFAYKELLASKVDSEKILISHFNLTNLEEFYLISRCKHFIIPRSSFSWWAAYLSKNPEKMVFAAQFDNPTLDKLFKNGSDKDYLKWQYGHIFYPTHWNTISPD